MPRQITAAEAKPFFAHPSQQKGCMVTPDTLPEGPEFEYWAAGPVCGVFHLMPWPDVWQGHYGVLTDGWGRTREPALAILRAFWAARAPVRIVGWTHSTNRAALAFARRLRFVVDGEMPLDGKNSIIMQGWTPWQ